MCDVLITYKAITTDDIAIICKARFTCHDDRWRVRDVRDLVSVYIPDRGKRWELSKWDHSDGERFENMWIYEIRKLLKEDDHDLLWELNAAADQQKHEGAV